MISPGLFRRHATQRESSLARGKSVIPNTVRSLLRRAQIADAPTLTRATAAGAIPEFGIPGATAGNTRSRLLPGDIPLMAFEKGTTNHLDPDLTTWSASSASGDPVPVVTDLGNGVYEVEFPATTGTNFQSLQHNLSLPAATYSASLRARLVSGTIPSGFELRLRDGATQLLDVGLAGLAPKALSYYDTAIAATGPTNIILVQASQLHSGFTIQVEGLQLETGDYPTSFVDGTRAADEAAVANLTTLNAPMSFVALHCPFYADENSDASSAYLFQARNSGGAGILTYIRYDRQQSNNNVARIEGDTDPFLADATNPLAAFTPRVLELAVPPSGDTAHLYFNGSSVATATSPVNVSDVGSLIAGSTGSSFFLEGAVAILAFDSLLSSEERTSLAQWLLTLP